MSNQEPPQWLVDYVENKEPLSFPDSSGETMEFLPAPIAELSLLKLWLKISPETFPLDLKSLERSSSENYLDRFGTGFEEENFEEENNNEEEEESDFITINKKFVDDAVQSLKQLLEQNTDIDQIRTEFVSLQNIYFANHVDCAVAIVKEIISNFDSVTNGLNRLGDLLNLFLENSDDQVDFFFWFQEWCAKDLENKKEIFSKVLIELEDRNIIQNENIAAWSDQQDDCNEKQDAIFNYYKEQKALQNEEEDDENEDQ